MFRTFPNVSHVKMMKIMIKLLTNAFQFANPIKFTTNNKENATLSKNSTDANAISITISRLKNAKTYAITDFNGFPQIRNVVHQLFRNSRISANIMSV
jgi:hypothetical protein